jgi:hypothetical protein
VLPVLSDGVSFANGFPDAMTFRIDRLIEAERVILRVSGRITSEDLEVLRAAIEEESRPVAIDLKDVELVDGDAIRFLASIEATGGALTDCPAFIREWIERERSQAKSKESE